MKIPEGIKQIAIGVVMFCVWEKTFLSIFVIG